MSMCVLMYSGGSRNVEKGFLLVVGPRRGGLGAQPPAAEDALFAYDIMKIQHFSCGQFQVLTSYFHMK